MSRIQSIITSRFMIIPAVALGVVFLVLMVKLREEPQRVDAGETALSVRVVPVLDQTMIPRVMGYGAVKPGRSWKGIAEVGGKVVALNPRFETGAMLPEGAELLRIDPLEYEIAVTRAQAQVQAVSAQLVELALERENLAMSLDLEQQNLRLLERDFRRNLALVGEGSISEAVTEQAERGVLRQRLQVRSLTNSLSVLPAKEDQLNAQKKQNQALLEDALRRLEKTTIKMPYDGRIALRNVELGQAVTPGLVLVEADGIRKAEIEVGLALDKMNALISGSTIDPARLTSPEVFEKLGLSALVRVSAIGDGAVWKAAFSRVNAGLDSGTRTVGVIVSVDAPYQGMQPGKRPPLVKGMLCEVEVMGPSRQALLIPRSALHGGRVFVADSDNRLKIIEVTVGALQSDFVEIVDGLKGGERIVISDVSPAIEGMLLEIHEDDAAVAQLQQMASGLGGVR